MSYNRAMKECQPKQGKLGQLQTNGQIYDAMEWQGQDQASVQIISIITLR